MPALTLLKLFGEQSLTLVAASFANGHDADRAAGALRRTLPPESVDVLRPREAEALRRFTPDGVGIWRTLWRIRVTAGRR